MAAKLGSCADSHLTLRRPVHLNSHLACIAYPAIELGLAGEAPNRSPVDCWRSTRLASFDLAADGFILLHARQGLLRLTVAAVNFGRNALIAFHPRPPVFFRSPRNWAGGPILRHTMAK